MPILGIGFWATFSFPQFCENLQYMTEVEKNGMVFFQDKFYKVKIFFSTARKPKSRK